MDVCYQESYQLLILHLFVFNSNYSLPSQIMLIELLYHAISSNYSSFLVTSPILNDYETDCGICGATLSHVQGCFYDKIH